MGLTINYRLSYRIPGKRTTAADCLQVLEKLRQAALDLPFETVSDLVYLGGKEADYQSYDPCHEFVWPLIQAQEHVYLDGHRGFSSISVPPKEVIFFSTWPGEECEEANFGLARYPASIVHRGQRYQVPGSGWRWHSFCKTQYASNVSVEHFLRCHSAVCTLLLKADELGFRVAVDDEGGFWGNWDFAALAREVGEWNNMVASFTRALQDVLDGSGASLVAPIQDNIAYVTAPQSPWVGQLASAIKRTFSDIHSHLRKTGEMP